LESLKGRDHVKVVGVNEMDLAEMVWEGVDWMGTWGSWERGKMGRRVS
jgi:hypothetical protein